MKTVENAYEVVGQNQEHDQFQDSIAVHKPKRQTCMPVRFDNMVIPYALPVVIEDSILSTYREVKVSSKSDR